MNYVPVLKGKEGEFAALEFLDPNIKTQVCPLIEVSPIPYDFTTQRNSKSLDEHLVGLPERIKKSWQYRPLYLQMPEFAGHERLADQTCPLGTTLLRCRDMGLQPIPTVTTSSAGSCFDSVRALSGAQSTGMCLRLSIQDFSEETDSEMLIEDIVRRCGRESFQDVDLMLDIGALGSESNASLLIARSLLSMVPRKEEWRNTIVTATSFPEDLSDVGSSSMRTLPRREWSLWTALLRKPAALPAKGLVFGDYAIAHPTISNIDPRLMSMSASIRYTTEEGWLIVKGKGVKKFGFDQYFDLCKLLVERPEYCGRTFSWADSFIDDCALEIAGPGNATTWRKVGVNHHISFVAKQIATRRAI